MNLYGVLVWIYRRIGQMTCFFVAGLTMMKVVLSDATEMLPSAIVSVAFLAAGLVLRHQHPTHGLK